ncbi:MAG: PDZ domain-containing protein [Thermoanaerobaculia bacterium]
MRRTFLFLLLAFAFGAQGLFRNPAVSRTHVAFVHDGQVWIVPRAGGRAVRVTGTPGAKFEVRFSPDGQRLAYGASEVRSAVDLYTIGIRGGTPQRVTYLPSHQVLAQWLDDDTLLFHTNALSFTRLEMQLFTVSAHGGLPRRLPLAFGSDGALNADRTLLAFTPQWPNPLIANWKRYRGGAAPDLSLADLRSGTSETITDWEGWDSTPMWRGAILYYVSDAGTELRRNVWSYDTRTKTRRQWTHFRDYDVLEASIGGDAIVFRNGATIQLLDLRTNVTSPVNVVLPPPREIQRDVDAAEFITSRQVSNGQVLYEARGDLWLASTGGAPRNLTSTSGVFEREAALSPDGSRIAYFSDATGEYQLYVDSPLSPLGGERARVRGESGVSGAPHPNPLPAERGEGTWTAFKTGFRYRPIWSRDGHRIAFTDQRGAIFIVDVAARVIREIDVDPWAELPELAWSADSSWLAYTRTGANRLSALWRYDVASGERRQLTADAFYAGTPAFDPAGTHLFFISYRNFSTVSTEWLSQRFVHRQHGVIMAVPLAGTNFTIEDIERRSFRLPVTPGAITSLGTTNTGDVVFGHTDANGASTLRIYRLGTKHEDVLSATGGELTIDGRQIVIEREGKSFVRDLTSEAEVPLVTTGMNVQVDLRAEWRQIFQDAWRSYRDFFFAPKRGAIDWDALRLRYLPLLEHCVTREEVNLVLADFIGESSVGHAYIANSGDVPRATAPGTGMLGADFELDRGAYRIAHIVQGAPWDDTARSPLAGVREGEYLLAVNGKPLDIAADPRAAFAGLAEKQVTITVGPNPTIDANAREVTVTTLASENTLRYRQWVEANRAYVDAKSNGRIGYVHIPEFTNSALGDFARQFSGQIAKEALIVDARWSLGGSTGHMLAESLARTHLNSAAIRESTNAWPVPRWGAHFGAKALLVNHITVSAGENFSYYFRKLALGPIIGARTWGGLTGLNPVPPLIDGGAVNVPNAPFFDESGWLLEGHGLEPDVPIARDPARETDAQLDAAIAALAGPVPSPRCAGRGSG